MIKLSNILVVLSIILLGGCAEPKVQTLHTEKTLPSWYLTPLLNNAEYIYGVGSGEDYDKSVKSALNNLISKLGISIKSTYKSNSNLQTGYREYFTKKTSTDLTSEVKKIRISNYEIINTQKQKYDFYVTLVRSNKELFKKSLIDSTDQIYADIGFKNRNISKTNPLTRYKFYENASKTLHETLPTLLVINSLDENFDNKKYLSQIKTIDLELDLLQKNMRLYFTYSKGYELFTNALKSSINDSGISISTVSKEDKNQLEIYTSYKVNKSSSNGFFIARVSISITIKNYLGNTINTQVMNAIGHSTYSIEGAIDDAAENFKDELASDWLF